MVHVRVSSHVFFDIILSKGHHDECTPVPFSNMVQEGYFFSHWRTVHVASDI